MLSLDDPAWSDLQDAYGSAEAIPLLLAQLKTFPDKSHAESEPWFSLWSALCHQGDVYQASFAAVPHIVATLASAPRRASFDYFLIVACIEVARHERNVEIPKALRDAYLEALAQMPALAGKTLVPGVTAELCISALAASAAAAGQLATAALLTDMELDDIDAMRDWIFNR
ncbi:hypothetical protein [Pseudoxanthomonas sp. GM95]|uniref:hypothetical protein n=1 Tax=Pseudoxanthomonas sp. GM95 TaxID=1881043 RepID=UPI0011136CC5|nr:hypothetical protein [Pseudoxanthomonas sp. GM95]